MSRKALKVVVEIKLVAVSCPGVHLPAKDDVCLSVCFMGQLHQSESLPAVFPLLFHEKMTFEKIYRRAVDPAEVAVMLEYETIRIELVQLVPPVGEVLACCEENARSFLFPEPKLVPSFSGVDRELLMTRAPHFPGIAPRLEFSTRTTIAECAPDEKMNIYPNMLMRPAMKRSRKRSSRPKTSSPLKNHLQTRAGRRGGSPDRGGHGADGLPRSQSLPSLGDENAQHLARLSLDSAAPSRSNWDASSSQPVGDTSERRYRPDASALWRSYREHARTCHGRSESSSHREWEEVHERVRGLLTTPKAVRRLIFFMDLFKLCEEVLSSFRDQRERGFFQRTSEVELMSEESDHRP